MIFVIFKAILAIYTLVWLTIFLEMVIVSHFTIRGRNVFLFLTSWLYVLLVLYMWTSLLDILFMSYKHVRNGYLRSIKDTLGHGKPSENTPLSTGRTNNNWEADDLTSISATNNVVKESACWQHKLVWVLRDITSGLVPMVCT